MQLRRIARNTLGVALASLAFACGARAARAAEPGAARLAVPESERPLTLPALVLAPAAELGAEQRPHAGAFGTLDVSAAIGISDDFELRALVAPIQLWSPDGGGGLQFGETNRFRGPGAGTTFRFLRGDVEIAASVAARVFTVPSVSGAELLLAMPLRVHATSALRLDATPTLNITGATQSPAPLIDAGATVSSSRLTQSADAMRFSVPLQLLYNFTDAFDAGLDTGLTIYDTSNVSNTTGIPLGAFLGYAVKGTDGPIADVDPYFIFPYLLMPGRRDVTNAGQYATGVRVTVYLYL